MTQYEKACNTRIFSKRFLKAYALEDIRNNGDFAWTEKAWLDAFVDWTITIFRITGK